jgi:hypothetical protein
MSGRVTKAESLMVREIPVRGYIPTCNMSYLQPENDSHVVDRVNRDIHGTVTQLVAGHVLQMTEAVDRRTLFRVYIS